MSRYLAWLAERSEAHVGDPTWVLVLLRFFVGAIASGAVVLGVLALWALGPAAIAVPLVALAAVTVGRLVIR